jgi:hypothetical protein
MVESFMGVFPPDSKNSGIVAEISGEWMQFCPQKQIPRFARDDNMMEGRRTSAKEVGRGEW